MNNQRIPNNNEYPALYEVRRDSLLVSTDQSKFDLTTIHGYLSRSYWSEEIPRELLERAVAHSLSFGLYEKDVQIGFARVITDYATFGYLADVFVLESHQGRGLGTWLMECIMNHPALSGFRRWLLLTRDAHNLYRKFGFTEVTHPERIMEIARPGLYKSGGKVK